MVSLRFRVNSEVDRLLSTAIANQLFNDEADGVIKILLNFAMLFPNRVEIK